MRLHTDSYDAMLESHLELEERLAETLEALNATMASMLEGKGIHGPTSDGLERVAPLLEQLKDRSEQSRLSRQQLLKSVSDELSDASPQNVGMRQLIQRASEDKTEQFDKRRKAVSDRLEHARHSLTATQAVIYYSMDFHRRYLMGILECTDDQSSYQATGQSVKLPTEKIFGRNC
ncbi:hypothetical protein [Rhodopirellula sp. MGV]|uniref:hypothetical protein n=1 Tax=Rhodopirellula sp. MGV TaxID=2023130 RepID=UPI000B967D46|nr:hypothetical protein [Rhodopirellula sp. MGV]OYP35230.1 hypothetical protein CGZ80_12605 [Rhodopirellula sp. MGV]PNY37841.1 hypothetical protein C2E31_05695 [Rhodopirellula baltica]